MKLPKRELPRYSVLLPASNVTVKYRPHTVKEEQILNMAQMSTEDADKLNAIFQIVENCVDYDINKIFPAEVEMLFMKIRATSDTPKIPIEYTIMPEYDDEGKNIHENCGEKIKSFFDIDKDIKIVYDEKKLLKHAEKARDSGWIINLGAGLKLKIHVKPVADTSENALYELVDCIIDDEPNEDDADENGQKILYKGVDFDKSEFMEWLNDMPSSAFSEFADFMSHLPSCVATLKFKCKCGQVIKEEEAGILSFLV